MTTTVVDPHTGEIVDVQEGEDSLRDLIRQGVEATQQAKLWDSRRKTLAALIEQRLPEDGRIDTSAGRARRVTQQRKRVSGESLSAALAEVETTAAEREELLRCVRDLDVALLLKAVDERRVPASFALAAITETVSSYVTISPVLLVAEEA